MVYVLRKRFLRKWLRLEKELHKRKATEMRDEPTIPNATDPLWRAILGYNIQR